MQAVLQRNGRTGSAPVRNAFGAILKELIRCIPCGAAMTPSHSTRKGAKRYRYYVCSSAQKRGWHTCPSKSIPAGRIEHFVAERLRSMGKGPARVLAPFADLHAAAAGRIAELEAQRERTKRETDGWKAEIAALGDLAHIEGSFVQFRLAELRQRMDDAEREVEGIEAEVAARKRDLIEERDVVRALASFDPGWESLPQREQRRLFQVLVERIDYDGAMGKISISFHASGFRTLAEQRARPAQEDLR